MCSFFDIAVRHFGDEASFVWLSNLEGIDLNSPEAEAAYERLFQLFPERLDIRAMRRLVARGYNFDRSFSMRNLQSGWSKSFYRDHENLGFTEVISSMFCLENNPKCEEVCRVMNGNTPFSLEKSGDFFIPFIRDQAKKSLRNLKGPQSVGPECTEFLKFQIKSKPGVLAELKREALKARAPNSIKYFEALATQSETFWATKVLGFSSEYDAQGWSATQALGKPNVSVCGDFRGSWAQKNNPNEWIKVGFERTLVPEKVKIYQNNEVGFVREIVLWNADGSKKEIPVSDPTTNCPGVLEVFVGDHGLPITALTVHVDGSHRSGFEEIDAIAIVGNASGP